MGENAGRVVTAPDGPTRADLTVFLERAARLDPSALVRLRRTPAGVAVWTTTAGFDTLAGRTFRIEIAPADLCVGAAGLAGAFAAETGGLSGVFAAAGAVGAVRQQKSAAAENTGAAEKTGATEKTAGRNAQGQDPQAEGPVAVEPGPAMDASWRGALPPPDGFEHVEDVPARELVALSVQGAQVARDNSTTAGPPRSLLDQTVLEVTGAGHRIEVPLRSVFALTSMGFVPQAVQNPVTGAVDVTKVPADEPVRVRATRTWARLDARYGSVAMRLGGEIPLLPG